MQKEATHLRCKEDTLRATGHRTVRTVQGFTLSPILCETGPERGSTIRNKWKVKGGQEASGFYRQEMDALSKANDGHGETSFLFKNLYAAAV